MAQTINVTRFIRGSRIGDNAQAVRIISNVIDFSLLNAASTDIVGALKLDAGTVVFNVGVKVITADGGAETVQIGDQTAANTYIGATSVATTATDVAAGLAAPVYYKADDYIAVKPSAALDAAKILVWAAVANVHGNV